MLIVGLGNVGKKYDGTRHNIGFALLDRWVAKYASGVSRKKWNSSETVSVKRGNTPVVCCWPTTFMNLSGDAVQEVSAFYHTAPQEIVVIQDDIDLPCGKLRIRQGGGDGGQKGIRSTIERLGDGDFIRVKLGVGRPPDPRFEVADWVLSRFSGEEAREIENVLIRGVDALDTIIEQGVKVAQNKFNASDGGKPGS
jgi:PTH1 family peptidyl-tRNA hydrolase